MGTWGRHHSLLFTMTAVLTEDLQGRESWEYLANTPSEMKAATEAVARDAGVDPYLWCPGWPRSPATFAKMVYRLSPLLKTIGITVRKGWIGRQRAIRLYRRLY